MALGDALDLVAGVDIGLTGMKVVAFDLNWKTLPLPGPVAAEPAEASLD